MKIQSPPGEYTSGKIFFHGENLMELSTEQMRKIRGSQISMIFQDPMTALNPVMTIGDQIAEGIRTNEKCSPAEARMKIQSPPGEYTSGKIFFHGENLMELSTEQMRKIRGSQISMIFQDPMTALNPVMTIGDQIAEGIRTNEKCSPAEARMKMLEILQMVRIPPERADDFPHQFSGGMKQRVVIAIALSCSPSLVIADEPTSALDVTIQAQVLAMINELKEKKKDLDDSHHP